VNVRLWWWRFARRTVELFCRAWWRAEVRGLENVPATGAYVIAPVHRSNIDTLLCGMLTRRQLRYMAKDSLWKYRWSGAFISSLGGFPVNRGTPDRQALRTTEEALQRGDPVVVFPEGTRRSGPAVQPLYEGAAFVAARAGVPIVPVGIGGSEWAMSKGSKTLRRVKVVMAVGKPIDPPARTSSGRVPRRVVGELTSELHERLQELFDEALAAAGRSYVT
jgi:1-acyl-sn-glycerol-3-phosphate acyltransferase